MDIRDLERILQRNINRELRRSWRCPAELSLAEYADGKTSERKRKRIEKHISNCGFCLNQVALLLALADSEPPQVSRELLQRAEALVENTPRRVIPKLKWNWALSAATVACGFLLVTVIWLGLPSRWGSPRPIEPTDYQTVRGSGGESTELTILAPSEGASLNRAAVNFKWNVLETALFYEVDVVDLEGNPMWNARVDKAEVSVPSSVTLPSGQYFLVIRAVMADGNLTSSKFVQFTLR